MENIYLDITEKENFKRQLEETDLVAVEEKEKQRIRVLKENNFYDE